MPQELLFEINAAFDHLSRYWQYDEPEEKVVHKACAHIKRACFDAYKLILKSTVDDYENLKEIDTSIKDNGEFDKRLIQLSSKLEKKATKARELEGNNAEDWHKAFEPWKEVYNLCQELKYNFVENENVPWARRKNKLYTRKNLAVAFVLGIITSLIASLIFFFAFSPNETKPPSEKQAPAVKESNYSEE
ncbi:MAG: hypothetical protein JXR76_22235 [Deltaproteobacteria bacterium]|nr:hypothetical protein [Deltaproteobacteria bacterium]